MRLIVEDLAVSRGGRPVLRGVSIDLARGGALVVTGANGAGKSTLLRTIAGLVRGEAGHIRIEGGEDPEAAPHEAMHLLGHRDGVKDALTAAENTRFATDFLGPGGGDVGPALAEVGLARLADLPAAIFSAGQRRRLALARLLVAPRPVWLLDEPTNALDAAGQDLLHALVARHRAAGGMVIAATHQNLGWPEVRILDLGSGIR